MRPVFYLCLLTALFISCSNNEGPLDEERLGTTFIGDVVLSSQEEIEEFGANGFTEIEGSLFIGNSDISASSCVGEATNISNLTSLSSLQRISIALTIANNSRLGSIDGFESLREVRGGILIENNCVLERISGFESLDAAVGGLVVKNNPSLVTISGFDGISTLNSGIRIENSPFLETVEFLNLEFTGTLTISNSSLSSFEGFPSLTGFARITISSSALTSLEGLENINISSTTGFIFENNKDLVNYCALNTAFLNNSDLDDQDRIRILTRGNAFDPTDEDIRQGNCLLDTF
nr:hypothetical protein [Allomuricauda sp.]